MCYKRSAILLFVLQIIFNEHFSNFVEGKRWRSTLRQRVPPDYTPFPQFGAAYKIFEIPSTWNEAVVHCHEDDAMLAIVDKMDKVKALNKLRTTTAQTAYLHVGVYWSKLIYDWIRADNQETIKTIPWAIDEPDGSGECVGINGVHGKKKYEGLIVYDCDKSTEFFVCEIAI